MELSLFFSLFWSVFKLFSYTYSLGDKGDQSLYPPHFWSMPSGASDIQRKLHCTRKGNQIVYWFWCVIILNHTSYLHRSSGQSPESDHCVTCDVSFARTSSQCTPKVLSKHRPYRIWLHLFNYYIIHVYYIVSAESTRFAFDFQETSTWSMPFWSLSVSRQKRALVEDNYFWKDLNRVLYTYSMAFEQKIQQIYKINKRGGGLKE